MADQQPQTQKESETLFLLDRQLALETDDSLENLTPSQRAAVLALVPRSALAQGWSVAWPLTGAAMQTEPWKE